MSLQSWIIGKYIDSKLKSAINAMPPGTKLKALGLASLLATLATAAKLLLDGDAATNPDWTLVIAQVTAAWGLLVARQSNVTSEEAGAGK